MEGTGPKGAVLFYWRLELPDDKFRYELTAGVGWNEYTDLYTCSADIISDDKYENASCTLGLSGWDFED